MGKEETKMDVLEVFGYIIMPTVFILGIGLVILGTMEADVRNYAEKQSCNKIGMEYYYSMESEFCIDKNNQAHYVKIECERLGFRNYNCIPRIISIGDIRTIK